MLAITYPITGSADMAVFAALSPLVLTMFSDVSGTQRRRVVHQVKLALATTVLIVLGTLASQWTWVATLGTFAVAISILFSGVVSSALATATTPLLISFVLPTTLASPTGFLADRLVGWLAGSTAAVLTVAFLWPAPPRDPLRAHTAVACARIARQLRVEAACGGARLGNNEQDVETAARETAESIAALRDAFFATPYRPAGLSTSSRAVVRLVDQVIWLGHTLEKAADTSSSIPVAKATCQVKQAAADLLQHGAALLHTPKTDVGGLRCGVDLLKKAQVTLERTAISPLAAGTAAGVPSPSQQRGRDFVDSLQFSFRAQRVAFAVTAIAENIELSIMACQRGRARRLVKSRLLGAEPALLSARERGQAHLERHSVWLHNSVRGAIALTMAVLVARVSDLEHSFWIVFGTLVVLRSSAVNTGQTVARALLGTAAGFMVAVGIILALDSHTTLLWVVLPLAIASLGIEPTVTPFTAGQAGFTVVLLMLFSIIDPVGWQIGLVRIQDMALGCAVSLAVGALFWPRGATAALGQALREALGTGAEYLRGAVEFGLTRCDATSPPSPCPVHERRQAAAAARRLDDAYREYLAERGAKPLSIADVTALVNAVAVLRLTADAIVDLWAHGQDTPQGDRTAVRTRIHRRAVPLFRWYEGAGRALGTGTQVPDRERHEAVIDDALETEVRRDLADQEGGGTATAARMVWTADHLDTLDGLRTDIDASVRFAAGLLHPQRTGRQIQLRHRHSGATAFR
ncbi:FUSC family protein [Streptomyces tendae]|uniref:FUSC family protein n=1 Tax=Streptomyces tendae TaxID=1932 RepID=UPI0033F64175